jgi:hypothetical protein
MRSALQAAFVGGERNGSAFPVGLASLTARLRWAGLFSILNGKPIIMNDLRE